MTFLEFRSPIDLHASSIASTRPPSDDEQFLELVREVFEHQRAVFGEPVPADQKSRRAKAFYDAYTPPNLAQGTDWLFGTSITPIEAFHRFFLSTEAANRNNVSFLVGDVGVGKSSFVNWMITRCVRGAVQNSQSWFVRLDLERIQRAEPLTYVGFLRALAKKVARVLEQFPFVLGSGKAPRAAFERLGRAIDDASVNYLESSLCAVSIAIQEDTGRRLCVILDNVDYLCHVRDINLFGRSLNEHEDDVIAFLLELIIGAVNHQNTIGQLGANILFAMRKDTLTILRASVQPESITGRRGIFDESRVFTLRPIPWKQALEARLSLLEHEIGNTKEPGKRRKFDELNTTLQKSLEAQPVGEEVAGQAQASRFPPLSDLVVGLAVKGLRELMEFFEQYVWISPADTVGETLERFVNQVPVGLLAYILDGKRLYSQTESKFPNVWITTSGSKALRAPRKCSFILKRAILSLVNRIGDTAVETVYDVLGGPKGYPDDLIEQALVDLADALT